MQRWPDSRGSASPALPGSKSETARLRRVFTDIYDKNKWLEGSGIGSRIDATEGYREYLVGFMEKKAIESVVDYGCGDWRFSACIPWGRVRYLGVDIVDSVISANIRKFGSEQVEFISVEEYETRTDSTADLFILKDVLQHLSYEKALGVLTIAKSFPFALITNDFCEENDDCSDGDYRPLNIAAPPFSCSTAREVYAYGLKRSYILGGPSRGAV